MLNVSVKITGDKELIAKLSKLKSEINNWHEALNLTGVALVSYYSGEVFSSHGGMFGTPWAKLAPSTVAYKSKHYRAYAAVPLMRTGTMKNSFTYEATNGKLTVGNTAEYFPYHQSSATRKKLPRRQMMGVDNHARELIRAIFEADLREKIARL